MKLKALAIFIIALYNFNSYAQQLIKSIPLTQPLLMTTDVNGNVYIALQNGSLTKYNSNGDSIVSTNSINNGMVSNIDATNPLKIMVYYQDFSKVVYLDNLLSVKLSLDLRKLGIYNPTAIGVSYDGMLWVYDVQDATLKKINDQLQIVSHSNDLRVETNEVPAPSELLSTENKIYLNDTSQGIYTFDRYGNYLNSFPFYKAQDLQVFNKQFIFRKGDSLISYNLQTNTNKYFTIPNDSTYNIVSSSIERNRMYVLYTNRLEIYNID